jgi:ABC-type cobalamin transport system ATPase subunit
MKVAEAAEKKLAERREIYGDGLSQQSTETLLHVIRYKATRLTFTKSKEKLLDDLIDIVALAEEVYRRISKL